MTRSIKTAWSLFALSLCANLALVYEVGQQSSVLQRLSEKPSELDANFVGRIGFSATDSVSGRPVEKLELVGAEFGGKNCGVSSAFDSAGRLVLFCYGTEPFDVQVTSPGYMPFTFTVSERTLRTSELVKIQLVPKAQ